MRFNLLTWNAAEHMIVAQCLCVFQFFGVGMNDHHHPHLYCESAVKMVYCVKWRCITCTQHNMQLHHPTIECAFEWNILLGTFISIRLRSLLLFNSIFASLETLKCATCDILIGIHCQKVNNSSIIFWIWTLFFILCLLLARSQLFSLILRMLSNIVSHDASNIQHWTDKNII